MPEEYVNYTITCVNGTWWAKIDGTYPLRILTESDGVSSCVPVELPMIYPTPPGTTNIRVKVNGTEFAWSNWSYDTHHTAIGDWAMIYCVVSPVSEYFLLTIHYEHPLAVVNGSSLFLYDLNISPYLTPLSNSSIAYFTVRFESAVSDVRAHTTWTDSVWNPKDFALSSEGDVETVTIEMRSVLGEPLAGDLVVMFNDSSEHVPEEFPTGSLLFRSLWWRVCWRRLFTERKADDTMRLLNNEGDVSFLPEFCLREGKRFTAFVLTQSGQLSAVACGSAGFHIQTVALSSFFLASPVLAKRAGSD